MPYWKLAGGRLEGPHGTPWESKKKNRHKHQLGMYGEREERHMTSFVRTIPRNEKPEYVDKILSRSDHHIPLKFEPRRARAGDFIYLAYRGGIVGRAIIDTIRPIASDVPIGPDGRPYHAQWLVRYRGSWQCSPRQMPFRGYQGIRYLDTMGLVDLDFERW